MGRDRPTRQPRNRGCRLVKRAQGGALEVLKLVVATIADLHDPLRILQQGASYERQRAVRDANAGSLTAVVDSLLAEMRAGRPLTDLARPAVPVPTPSPAPSA